MVGWPRACRRHGEGTKRCCAHSGDLGDIPELLPGNEGSRRRCWPAVEGAHGARSARGVCSARSLRRGLVHRRSGSEPDVCIINVPFGVCSRWDANRAADAREREIKPRMMREVLGIGVGWGRQFWCKLLARLRAGHAHIWIHEGNPTGSLCGVKRGLCNEQPIDTHAFQLVKRREIIPLIWALKVINCKLQKKKIKCCL